MNAPGLLLAFEGIDGSGKSTQARLLADALEREGLPVQLGREPTDGKWGRLARESGITGRLAPEDELELFHKDRREHVETRIAPALKRGEIVVLDRYYFSTMAYQGARGFDPTELRAINESFAPPPDLLLLFDLPVEQALERIGGRGEGSTEFERRDSLQRCRDIFLSLKSDRFTRVFDATQAPDTLHQAVLTEVRRLRAERGSA